MCWGIFHHNEIFASRNFSQSCQFRCSEVRLYMIPVFIEFTSVFKFVFYNYMFCQPSILASRVRLRAKGLYGKCFMMFNVHQLSHLGICVKLGQLWACFVFPFELGNEQITKIFNAASMAAYQTVERVVVHEDIRFLFILHL